MGRIPGTRRYSDIERNPENETGPGLLIVRVEAPLLYFNANHVRETVRGHLGRAGEPVRLLVFDLSTSPHVDVTAALMLSSVQRELSAAGIQLRFVEAHASVRDLLRTGGTECRIGQVSRRVSLDDLVESFRAAERPPEAPRTHAE